MATGLLYDSIFLEHDTGPGHPERPERLSLTFDHLRNLPWFKDLKPLKPRKAEAEWLSAVHAPGYLRHAEETCRLGLSYLDTPDVAISGNSFDIALLAAGGALEMADQVISGDIQNGFALVRPPGHHAENAAALGFCLMNNAAILARYLQKKHGKMLTQIFLKR